jgi:hypothetical protein
MGRKIQQTEANLTAGAPIHHSVKVLGDLKKTALYFRNSLLMAFNKKKRLGSQDIHDRCVKIKQKWSY